MEELKKQMDITLMHRLRTSQDCNKKFSSISIADGLQCDVLLSRSCTQANSHSFSREMSSFKYQQQMSLLDT